MYGKILPNTHVRYTSTLHFKYSLRTVCAADRELAISLYRVTQRTAALAVLAFIYMRFGRFHDFVVHRQPDIPAGHVR